MIYQPSPKPSLKEQREECQAKSAKRKSFMTYMRGWRHGASIQAIDYSPGESTQEYDRGYVEGRNAYHRACADAEEWFDYKQLVLVPQDGR